MDIPGLLQSIKSSRGYEDQIVHIEDILKRQPEYADIELSPPVKNALASIGIEKLYSHQASAIERIRSGEDVVIVTSTASGKSLAYMIPVFEKILASPKATALYIAPTNALVNDQLAGFNEFRDALGLA